MGIAMSSELQLSSDVAGCLSVSEPTFIQTSLGLIIKTMKNKNLVIV
jgi:hypothetical protein